MEKVYNRYGWYVLLIAIVITATVISILQEGQIYAQQHPPIQKFEIGDTVTDFTLEDFKGEKFILSSELNSADAILLWFTNLCEGCQRMLPEMEKIKHTYEKKGIKVAAVSVLGEDRETVGKIIYQKSISLRFLYDQKGEVTNLFSGSHYPGTCPLKNIFLIGKDRRVIYTDRYPGVDESKLKEQLNKIR